MKKSFRFVIPNDKELIQKLYSCYPLIAECQQCVMIHIIIIIYLNFICTFIFMLGTLIASLITEYHYYS